MITKMFLLDAVKKAKVSCNHAGIGIIIESQQDYCEVWPTFNLPNKFDINISIKGSDSDYKDWIGKWGNLSGIDVNHDNMHDGFANSYYRSGLRGQLITTVSDLMDEYPKLTPSINVYMYSRGGGIGNIFMKDFAETFDKPINGVSFGSPPSGNEKFVQEFNKLPINLTRVVNGYDLVATANYHLVGLYHVGYEYKLWQLLWHKYFHKIRDHRIGDYEKAINKLK